MATLTSALPRDAQAARTTGAPHATNPYDPLYDPLVSPAGRNQGYAPTYWVDTAGEPPPDDGPVTQDMETDVVVIGSGFTGLVTALNLAEEHGVIPIVLEANQESWGCTSRNGGQGQNASGRLYRTQWIERWGLETAKRLDREIHEGFDYWKSLVARFPCDAQHTGHIYTAHRPKKVAFLENLARVMREQFGYQTEMLTRDELWERFAMDREAAGAMYEPEGVGIHPLKLAFGYLRRLRELGVKIHTGSPVLGWETIGGIHHLRTPGGIVRARRVAVATGGYTPQGLHPLLNNKIMPILSNSIVTRPLTDAEREAAGLRNTTFLTDTRTLRFYYRLLPDGAMQIGSRSALTGADAKNPKHLELLKNGLVRKFPALKDVPIQYSWWGWVDVSHDMMPRITQPDPGQNIFYAIGYGGNGVAFSAQAGRRLAQRVVGKSGPQWELPIYNSPLNGHLFAPFRRLGQAMLYKYYYLRDEVL
ncbi:MAG: NAD(P)/FAD-dependent oxidoreductase [Castellaniella sp.]|uniref:NAD(P)/FAD-dependent oxidoreductase n=1 Tax=Castellaniella sp. TaxID=1955812 RepID=UPI003A8696D1